MSPYIIIILAAIAFGLWTVFHQIASTSINQVLGAVIVSATAVVIGLVTLLVQQVKFSELTVSTKGVTFLVLAGVMAFALDILALKAYAKGIPITVGAPILIGGSIVVASVIGVLMGESVSVVKITGLILVVGGAIILSMTTA